jgi:hypothetical protein
MPKNKKPVGVRIPRHYQITSPTDWKTSGESELPAGLPLGLPSGNTCLVQPIGAEAFISNGLIPNNLLPIVADSIDRAIKGKEESEEEVNKRMMDLAKEPGYLEAVFKMADDVTLFCVLSPKVEPVPVIDESGEAPDRDPEKLYVDQVDIDDKLFIMQFALGGTRDLERFRSELADAMVTLSPVGDGEATADGAPSSS